MSGLRILVVEDHEDSARALKRLLSHEGHTVSTAHNVADATAIAGAQTDLDLLISDISLPDGDGCELLRRLRGSRGGAPMPAIALTGHGEEHWVEECREAGYREFMTKPVVYEQLLAAVRSVRGQDGPPAGLGGIPAPAPRT
jgi:CheY-like chemotaxis protein